MAAPQQHGDSSADEKETRYKDVEAPDLEHAAGVWQHCTVHDNCAVPECPVQQVASMTLSSHTVYAGNQRSDNGTPTVSGNGGKAEALDGLSAGAEAAAVIMHDSETEHPDVLLR